MLFTDPIFIYVYCPITIIGFYFFRRHGYAVSILWLAAASIFFYGWWRWESAVLLGGSILFNYFAGQYIAALAGSSRTRLCRLALGVAIGIDLAVLGYFKYANFFLQTVNGAFELSFSLADIVLPLGVSFFTFTQIAYLVDVARGRVKGSRFADYLLFVTYFPHLIAGPVIHHAEVMPQFRQPSRGASMSDLAAGLTLFVFGLVKKTLLADGVSPFVAPTFDAAAKGEALCLVDSWMAAIAYAMQIYFDFSGYSDMAIGLSLMLGIRLPVNFNSPYQSVNIAEFWRRWHMTLSRFLRDYLYFPLGGNRQGSTRRHLNLMIVMVLGGGWHGAGWTFLAWGALHGSYLIVYHHWAERVRPRLPARLMAGRAWRGAAIVLTFACVTMAWVFFRAPDIGTAGRMVHAMLGLDGLTVPGSSGLAPDTLAGRTAARLFGEGNPMPYVPLRAFSRIAALLGIAWLLPNSQQIMASAWPALEATDAAVLRLGWRPSLAWGMVLAVMAAVAIWNIDVSSEFLYFQF